MKRIAAGKIPGFPPHITSTFVAQEIFGSDDMTPVDILLEKHKLMKEQTKQSNEFSISKLEEEMDALDMEDEEAQEQIESICNRIAELEEGVSDDGNDDISRAHKALEFFGVSELVFNTPTSKLSGGTRKKIALACILMEMPQLLLIDEPTWKVRVCIVLSHKFVCSI